MKMLEKSKPTNQDNPEVGASSPSFICVFSAWKVLVGIFLSVLGVCESVLQVCCTAPTEVQLFSGHLWQNPPKHKAAAVCTVRTEAYEMLNRDKISLFSINPIGLCVRACNKHRFKISAIHSGRDTPYKDVLNRWVYSFVFLPILAFYMLIVIFPFVVRPL